ncbi:MAG: CcmD family protein [Bacteroidales bacterium]|nr:CcmD family protein [Bacteroidales bacterium]
MTPDNKIYIVVAVLAVILVGIFVYLFFMDRKVSKLEKEIQEDKRNITAEGREV